MLLHKKPVLARRGQSVGRLPVKSSTDAPDSPERSEIPPLKYPSQTSISSGQSRSSLRNGSGGHNQRYKGSQNISRYDLDHEDEPDRIVGFTFAADGSISPVHKSKSIRPAASTGNLVDEPDDRYRRNDRSKLSSNTKLKSKSSYLETEEDENEENYLPNGSSRVSRRDGPFGEVTASKHQDSRGSLTPPEIIAPTFSKKTTNGRLKPAAPPKVYKG